MKQALEYLESFAVLVLILVGLTGFAYHLFREEGLANTVTCGIWDFIMASPFIAFVVLVCASTLGFVWRRNRRAQREQGKAATVVFYAMIASGVYFLGKLVIFGSF
ncbi:MAG: hypothetical protein IT529_00825 [Burkholderiales bacterium]|nr:hypothetical protein [Burkholderiales bacterium]